MRRALAMLACLSLLLASPAAALAAPQRASLPDIEDEVMCVVCGTPLNVSQSPQADRERAFIQRLIDQGTTKAEIKQALVAQYGERVLGLPKDSGVNVAVYVVPIVAVLVAAGVIGFSVMRWRRARTRPGEPLVATSPRAAAEDKRLSADLERYEL
jgi:cytochrome c-type biogenesis protein CcmH/NrfF